MTYLIPADLFQLLGCSGDMRRDGEIEREKERETESERARGVKQGRMGAGKTHGAQERGRSSDEEREGGRVC